MTKLRLKVYLDEGQRVAEIFVTPATKCRDIVQRLQRQIHGSDCFLIEVWQGCERLVPDNESILSTLLEWGSDLDDVKFYLRPREDTPSYTQVINHNGSSSQRVNGFKEEPPQSLSRDVLLGGSRISVNDLKEFAARQQQEIVAKERELKTRQVQLMEMKRKSQNKPQNPYIEQLSTKADEQEKRLKALRQVQDQVDSYKLSNSALAEELDNVRSLFMEKEKELAIAVVKVESLTQQLDKQRKGWSQSSPSREKTHQELELERLRKELMTRNELNHQQSVQIQSQKQLLAEKHKELFELDAEIDRYTNDLRQKRSQDNHTKPSNHRVNGSASPTGEQDFVEMDYSNLGSFSKRSNKTSNGDSKNANSNGSAPVTSGSFRGRARNARKLETLLEVEEEISDGHASNKSSTEDLTQGPGPPRASRVTTLKSRFQADSVTKGGKRSSSRDRESGGKNDITSSTKLSNSSSNTSQRVEPEGVETPVFPSREMFDLDGVHSMDEERGKRYYSMNEFLDISSLKTKPSGQDAVENTEKRNPTLQQGEFEVPHSAEIKHILSGFDLKTEAPSCSTESSTLSDGGDFSGPSSPSSFSSSSSASSNSITPKAAVFAIMGVAKRTDNIARPSEPPQNRGFQRLANTAQYQGLPDAKTFQASSVEPEEPIRGLLSSESGADDLPLQARLVKSEAFPTKNENVGLIARGTVMDLSRTGTKPKRLGGTSTKQNDGTGGSDGQRAHRLTDVKALETKLNRMGVTTTGSDHGEHVPNQAELKTSESSVKTAGKVQLSRLRYQTPAPLNNGISPQRDAMHNSESQTRLQRNVEDSSSSTNEKARLEDTKMAVDDSSLEISKQASMNSTLPLLPEQNSMNANGFAQKEKSVESSPSFGNSNEDYKSEHINDETDNAKRLSDAEQSSGKPTYDRSQIAPLIFKPISFRAKKMSGDKNVNTSTNRSQLAPLISNSISIRGQASSLTKITVTPSASFFSARNAMIPEKRSPVPTSKRTRFMYRGVAPTYPEVNELQVNDDSSNDTFHDDNEQKHVEFVDKESFEKETALTLREQGNKPRKPPRQDAKQVVSSFNIQLSSQNKKTLQEQEDISPSEGNDKTIGSVATGSKILVGKELNSESGRLGSESRGVHHDSSRLSSESGRLSSESGRLGSESGRPSSESGGVHYDSSRLSSESGEQSSESVRLSSESSRLSSESGQKSSESGQLSSENGQLSSESGIDKSRESLPLDSYPEGQTSHTVNSENGAGSIFWKSQLEQAHLSKNVLTQSLLKPLPSLRQVPSPIHEDAQKSQESFPSKNAAQKLMVLSNGESLSSELSPARTSPSGNMDDTVSERSPSNDKLQRNVETKTIVTIRDFPLKITDVDEAKPVAVNGDIGLVSQSHEPISDQLSNTPLTASVDNKAKSELANGDIGLLSKSHEDFSKGSIASEEAAEEDLAPAQKTVKKKKARHVSLDPHAVLLDAAVEGELDLVKQVIREVDNPSKPNSDGITALHNAVCACHDQVVQFLVQYGADINSPDSHGWTPFHCAAANNATEMARFLVQHGACIFAATSLEKKTPLQCCERGVPGYFNCMRYLNDVQQNFGLVNEGRVYALYNYSADEQDELSFECGEELLVLKRGDATEKEWWWAQNKDGETGYIPRNLLGLHARISPEV